MNLVDFQPVVNTLEKEVIVFQGQKQKVGIPTLTGIASLNSFTKYLSRERIQNEKDVTDMMTFIVNNDEIEVGSKPFGTSRLNGAYCICYPVGRN